MAFFLWQIISYSDLTGFCLVYRCTRVWRGSSMAILTIRLFLPIVLDHVSIVSILLTLLLLVWPFMHLLL